MLYCSLFHAMMDDLVLDSVGEYQWYMYHDMYHDTNKYQVSGYIHNISVNTFGEY